MAILCDIVTIAETNCILTIINSSGDAINEFNLVESKFIVSTLDDFITIFDNSSTITVQASQLPSINGGAYATIADLYDYLEGLRTACTCPCPGGGGSQNLNNVLLIGNDGGGLEIVNILDPTTAQSASTKNYVDVSIASAVIGLWDDRGNFSALGGAYPSTGGSGTAGAILKGDIWTISVAGTLPTGQVVNVGDTVRALIDTPANLQANWAIGENNIGYVPENQANKQNSLVVDGTGVKYPTVDATNAGLATKQNTITPQAFSNVDDTNITVSLGGSFATAVLNAMSITLGWTGILSIARGGTNSSTALSNNRIMRSSGGAIVEATAITANRALVSDVNGIPTQSATTDTELGYVSGVTSSIQTQITNKQSGSIMSLMNVVTGASTTLYYAIAGANSSVGAAFASLNARQIVINACTVKNFVVKTTNNQSATGSQVLTIFKNSSATAITITIAAGSAAGTFSDRTNSATFANDDRICMESINNATATGATVNSFCVNQY